MTLRLLFFPVVVAKRAGGNEAGLIGLGESSCGSGILPLHKDRYRETMPRMEDGLP
jgi:hypothetical protein